jgi:hypothetical protein
MSRVRPPALLLEPIALEIEQMWPDEEGASNCGEEIV